MIQTTLTPHQLDRPRRRLAGLRWRRAQPAAAGALRWATVAVAAVAVAVYLWIALHRIAYPFDLEWLEGNSLVSVQRILHGQSLYPPPSVHFVPDGYTPLYFYLSATVASVVGLSLLALRLVSFTASMACFVLLYLLVAKEVPGRRGAQGGAVAAGLYAASYVITGPWFDLARVDSLFLALALAGALVARHARRWWPAAAAGLLMALAFLTKQVALPVAAGVALALLARPNRRRLGGGFVVGFAGALVASTLAMSLATGGWYRYYALEELTQHGLSGPAWATFVTQGLGPLLPASILVAVAAVGRVGLGRPGREWSAGPDENGHVPILQGRLGTGREGRAPLALHCLFAAGLGLGALLEWVHTGASVADLIPAYLGVALLAGLALATISVGATVGWLLALLQLVLLLSMSLHPSAQVPSAADLATGRHLVSALRAVPGPVLIPSSPTLDVAAGKAPFSHQGAVSDVLRAHPGPAIRRYEASVAGAVDSERFTAIVVEQPSDLSYFGLPADLAAHYRACPGLLLTRAGPNAFYPITDLRVRPRRLYVRVGSHDCTSPWARRLAALS